MQDVRHRLARLVNEIRGLQSSYESSIARLKPIVDGHPGQASPSTASADFWKTILFYDALIRVRLLIEQNFHFIESMGLLATTRYLFELLVWMKTVHDDERYAHVYYAQLVEKQSRYWVDYESQLTREIALLRRLAIREESLAHSERESIEAIASTIERAAYQVDQDAARMFKLYGDEARHNGYAFQAHLVESSLLPRIQANAMEVQTELKNARELVPPELQKCISRWEWKAQAVRVGMGEEYEFIYTFSSRLLHATPPSISTDQKNLEVAEMLVFLRYIRVTMQDVLDLAETQVGRAHHH